MDTPEQGELGEERGVVGEGDHLALEQTGPGGVVGHASGAGEDDHGGGVEFSCEVGGLADDL